MSMQRFTVNISQEPGRRLGLVLVDEEALESESESDHFYYGCDFDDDEDAISIRGGGGSTIDPAVAAAVAAGGGYAQVGLFNSIGARLQNTFAAEAVAATAVVQGRILPPPQLPPGININKRKRPTKLHVSENSTIFKLAAPLFAASTTSSSSLEKKQEATASKCPTQTLDPFDVDALIAWGRKNAPKVKFRNGSMSLDDVNTAVLRFVLTRTIEPGDIVEKIQHRKACSRFPSTMTNMVSSNKAKSISYRRTRRSRPYFRSHHYTTVHTENMKAVDVAAILRKSEYYPLYITFKRQSLVSQNMKGLRSSNSPPRKRLKKSESHVPSAAILQPQNGVICLLDSSDEEEEGGGKDETLPNGGNAKEKSDAPAQDPIEIDSSSDSSPAPHPKFPPPDPPTMPLYDDDFVVTPFGAGKILSSRVERYASSDIHSEGTIFKPTIIYSIDLHFGICHVPASQVKTISGTSYTDKTLITYKRVPINEHDLLRLRPMTYLNDSIINFYLKYLKAQVEPVSKGINLTKDRGWDDLDGEGVHIFPSFCYTRIKGIMGDTSRNSKMIRTKIWKDLASWTKGVDIFKKKLLCFPVNESLHWTCVFVCHPGRMVRRYAKDLQGGKANPINLENATTCPNAIPTAQPGTNHPDKKEEPLPEAGSNNAVPDTAIKSSEGDKNNPKDQPQSHDTTNGSQVSNGSSGTGDLVLNPHNIKTSTTKWQCDFCQTARLDTYDEAVAHEKVCDMNVDWCMIHFDSGKGFKLHKTTEITGNIRKYLNAYYEAEYAASHPGLSMFTMKNMPGFAAAIPQQDNTKDCGVYMLENAERMLQNTPLVDNEFVKRKGSGDRRGFFGGVGYDKHVIEKKRDDILQLIQTLCRGDNLID